jgi:hypothetical protein
MLHCLGFAVMVIAAFLIAILGLYLLLRTGFSVNGHPMRYDPAGAQEVAKSKSWYIEGVAPAGGVAPVGVPISCSFVEFD